jgi:hypothetical protein
MKKKEDAEKRMITSLIMYNFTILTRRRRRYITRIQEVQYPQRVYLKTSKEETTLETEALMTDDLKTYLMFRTMKL